ncbi:MAG: hypothetical protein ACTSRH_04580 [Promethearchaeota archaeon]
MAEEFNSFLSEAKKSPLEEKVNAFGDIVEKMMTMILRIPDLVDQSISTLNERISNLESKINAINNEINQLKVRQSSVTPAVTGNSNPNLATPATSPPPSNVPPPPRGPPGSPPPPAARPASPTASRSANPQSLRGAIMSELKMLFAKRQNK